VNRQQRYALTQSQEANRVLLAQLSVRLDFLATRAKIQNEFRTYVKRTYARRGVSTLPKVVRRMING